MDFPFRPDNDDETPSAWYRSSRVLALCLGCLLLLGLLGLGKMLFGSRQAVPEPGLPVAGDAPQEAASNAASQPNPPTSKTIEATATAASPKSADEAAPADATLPTQYVDETYGGTYHRRANGKWEVVDNASGRVVRVDKEVSRTADFVELFTQNPPPNQQFRLFPNRIERMVNGKWQWIANGHWKTSSGTAGGVPRVTAQELELFGEKYKGQIVQMSCLFESVGDAFVTRLPGDRAPYSQWCSVSVLSNFHFFGYIFARKEQFGKRLIAMKRDTPIVLKGEVVALPRESVTPSGFVKDFQYGLICEEIKNW